MPLFSGHPLSPRSPYPFFLYAYSPDLFILNSPQHAAVPENAQRELFNRHIA